MKFASCLTLGASLVATAQAAANAFTYPLSNVTIQAGSVMDITWTNQSGSTVDILLKQGDATNLHTVATIGSNVQNQGGVAWTVPTDLKTGQYALELEADGQDPNYTSFFTIIGENVTSSSSESLKTSTTAGALVATSSSNATATTNATATQNSTATHNATTNATTSVAAVATTSSANSTAVRNGSTATNSTGPVGNSTANSTAVGGANKTTSSHSRSVALGGLGGDATTSTELPSSTSSAASGATRSASGSASATGSASSSAPAATSSKAATRNGASVVSWSAYAVTGALGVAAIILA